MTPGRPSSDAGSARPLAPGLVEALVGHQRAMGAGPRAEAAAAALGRGARVVVTGQQPGLLGGPLLVLHKALGALAEARARSRGADPTRSTHAAWTESGSTEPGSTATVPTETVAVFFVAADDHDWDEVNDLTVFDADGQARVLSLDHRADGRSVGDVVVSEAEVEALRAHLRATLPQNAFCDEALALTHLPPGPTDLSTWFTRVLTRLLGDVGLVFVTPRLLAPFSADVFASLVDEAEAIGEAVRADGEAARAIGRPVPLAPRAGDAPLFLRPGPGGPRQRIALDGDRVRLRGEPSGHTRASLRALVREAPHLASADVVGRVLLQDALLPVDVIVAGPTEAAYLAATAGAHRHLGLVMPTIVPRPSVAWADERTVAALRAVGLSPVEVAAGAVSLPPAPDVAALRDATREDDASFPDDEVGRRLHALALETTALADSLEAVGDAERDTLRSVLAARRALEAARVARHRARDDAAGVARRRASRAFALLRPRGRAQERVLSPLSLVARYGLAALRRHLDDVAAWRGDAEGEGPRVIVVGGPSVASSASPASTGT